MNWTLDDGTVDENDAPSETNVNYPRSDESRAGGLPKFEEVETSVGDEADS